jgi:hypothetical protein
MHHGFTIALGLAAAALMAPGVVQAQESPPTYKADPDVYKLVFEDMNFRIISATWQPGQTDKPHSHLSVSVAYALTDCSLRVAAPNGEFAYINTTVGTTSTVAFTPSHTATNEGTTICRVLLIERK